jgi:hypothetical protein
MTDRGEYRCIYTALVDDPDFQELSADARALFYPLKLKLGRAGIDVFYAESLPTLSGIPSERVREGLAELSEGGWLRIERNVFWLRNALRFDPAKTLQQPNQRTSIQKHIATLPKLAIVNDFAEYYDLAKPFTDKPKTKGSAKGSERVREGQPIREEGVGSTEEERTTKQQAGAEEIGSGEEVLNGLPPVPPDGEADRNRRTVASMEFGVSVLGTLREYVWLNENPPRKVKTTPAEEVKIVRTLALRYGAQDLLGAMPHLRDHDDVGATPLSIKFFNRKEHGQYLSFAIDRWRKERDAEERKGSTLGDLITQAQRRAAA